MLTSKALLEKGYLPYELVPAITTESLANNLSIILPNISTFTHKNSKSTYYSIPKVKSIRRSLSIPNPLHQIRLSQLLVDNWAVIENYVKQSYISLSTPIIADINDTEEERSIKRAIRLADIPFKRADYSHDSRFLLVTDISRFYPTIYTHSIPWALHTKEVAKSRKTDKHLLGNKIDESLRNTQDTQTMGIPIGPDTSLIISEIIGTAIDLELDRILNVAKIKYRGFRYVDDYYLYFRTRGNAELAINAINVILTSYELEINSEKTNIIELPTILEAKWALDLRRHPFDNYSGTPQTDNLISYFSTAYELSKQYPYDSVLKYALNEIEDVLIDRKYWGLYESLILKSMISEPSVLPTATEIFLAYKQLNYPLNYSKIRETLFELITYHSKYEHSHEVAWALWLCKSLKLRIIKDIASEVSKMQDDIVALIALDLHDIGLVKSLKSDIWQHIIDSNDLYSNHWLLVYQAYQSGWLNPSNGIDYIAQDPFFKTLRDNHVSFYNGVKQVKPAMLSPNPNPIISKQIKIDRRRKRRGY